VQLMAGWHARMIPFAVCLAIIRVKISHVFLWVMVYVCYCRCVNVVYKHCDFELCKSGVILASYVWCISNKSIFYIYITVFFDR
jgi:hypothetical protein